MSLLVGVAFAPALVRAQTTASAHSLVGRVQPVFPSEGGAAIVITSAEADWAEGEPHLIAAYGLFVAARPVSDRLPAEQRAWLGREARVLVGNTAVTTSVRALAIFSVVGSLDALAPTPSADDSEIARSTVRLAETSWLVGLTDVVGEEAGLAAVDPTLVPRVVPSSGASVATRNLLVRAMLTDAAFENDAVEFVSALRRDDEPTQAELRAALVRALRVSEIVAHGRRLVLARYSWDDDCGGGTTTLLLERTPRGLVRIGRISHFVALVDFGPDADLLLVTEQLETLSFDAIGRELIPVGERHHVVLGCRC